VDVLFPLGEQAEQLLQLGSASLLSRDRAVLKLARRAREAGIAILTPEAWAMPIGA